MDECDKKNRIRLLGGRLPWELLRSLVVPFLSLLIGQITHYISCLISSSSHRFQTHHHDRANKQPACVYEELGFVGERNAFPDDVLLLVFTYSCGRSKFVISKNLPHNSTLELSYFAKI